MSLYNAISSNGALWCMAVMLIILFILVIVLYSKLNTIASLRGPVGPIGPIGPVGMTGPTGPAGPVGLAGSAEPHPPFTMSNSIEFFGDSITRGYGLGQLTDRWTKGVSTKLNKTEVNFGVDGIQWAEAANVVYTNHVPGTTVFLAYGVNDIRGNQTAWGQLIHVVNNMILYTSLPDRCIINLASLKVTKSGNWSTGAGPYNIGVKVSDLQSANPLPTLTFNAKGRYIAFSTIVLTTGLTSISKQVSVQLTIDGVAQEPSRQFNTMRPTTMPSPQTYSSYLTIYDTGAESNVTRQCVLTPSSVGGYTEPAWIDYAAAFNTADLLDCKGTFVMEPSTFDFEDPANEWAARYYQFCTMLQRSVRFFRQMGFPVFYIGTTLVNDQGTLNGDKIHPNPLGHGAMARRVVEYVNSL